MCAGATYEELASLSSVPERRYTRCRAYKPNPATSSYRHRSKLVETSRYRKHRDLSSYSNPFHLMLRNENSKISLLAILVSLRIARFPQNSRLLALCGFPAFVFTLFENRFSIKINYQSLIARNSECDTCVIRLFGIWHCKWFENVAGICGIRGEI